MRIRGNFCLTEINNESIECRIIVHVMNTVVAAATWHYQKAYLISGTKTKQGPSIPFADPGIFARVCVCGGGGVLSLLLENSSDNVIFSFTPQLI